MAPYDQNTEVVPPAEVPEDVPLPLDPKVIFLGGLFVLAVLAAAYVASEIVLPLTHGPNRRVPAVHYGLL